jgi:hypothetical protein
MPGRRRPASSSPVWSRTSFSKGLVTVIVHICIGKKRRIRKRKKPHQSITSRCCTINGGEIENNTGEIVHYPGNYY